MNTKHRQSRTFSNSNTQPTGASVRDPEFEADVLFQRICNKWYAFTVVEEDCLVQQVPDEEVYKRLGRKTPRAS